jgi:ribonuclease HI
MEGTKKPRVDIFTDGACSGNPGVGGYGALLRSSGREKEISGYEPLTTNNRMELIAVIKALEALKKPCRVTITTDSHYVVQGITTWIYSWMKNHWKNSRKENVINRDLWERLFDLSQHHDISWQWIKGHENHVENERCDKLAKRAIKRYKQGGPPVHSGRTA